MFRFVVICWVLFVSLHDASAADMRGMWVYKTRDIAASAEASEQLFTFCEKRHITDLFWQVHFAKKEGDVRVLEDAEAWRSFLKRAHAHSLRVHALFGDPAHALKSRHGVVLGSIDGVLSFNKESSADSRFDGVHLDIEPHGLARWKLADVSQKCDLLTQFVEVNHAVVKKLQAADAKLILGVDIVFWLDKANADGSAAYPVTFNGVTKDPAKHLLDVVDHVAIMSYRGKAEGRNGIIPLVSKTIASADATKAKVFVGVKMADIGPKMEGFFGQTETQMMKAVAPIDETYRSHASYAGLAFFTYEAYKTMKP
ncbi:hypothetical protein BGE01nite_26800 [Brevifollis gellanilyticus]|uniref:Uncharacterized protein n=2 Tax=Brevifollis gellanilyticus TaxID=748831 RepID=A0A512M9I3_9BACT|nr:hypothetical protein BGE01nite_26800 [Brevifollis gellanilyticus]